jgi:hypothetical protein
MVLAKTKKFVEFNTEVHVFACALAINGLVYALPWKF